QLEAARNTIAHLESGQVQEVEADTAHLHEELAATQASCRDLGDRLADAESRLSQQHAVPDGDAAALSHRLREMEQAHDEAYTRWAQERRELNEQWEARLQAQLEQSPDQQPAAWHQELSEARRKIEQLREQVVELEARASQVATLDADLREARATIARQQAEAARQPNGRGAPVENAVEAAFTDPAWSWLEPALDAKSAPAPVAGGSPRDGLEKELAQLRQENA